MNIQTYIETGILELYALDLIKGAEKTAVEQMIAIYPALAAELRAIEHALEMYARSNAVQPPLYLESKMQSAIIALNRQREIDLNDLPLISSRSDHHSWLRAVHAEIPEQVENGRYCKLLRSSDGVVQMLLVSSADFEDEVHHELLESFLILSGKCQCTVGHTTFTMEAGDYTEIPLHQVHNVKILSTSVVAILQRVSTTRTFYSE